jgi:hypothetical protein
MTTPCRVTVELRQHELAEADAEEIWERKLAIFREDPYSHCEWNIEEFSVYDMLDIVLDALLPDFDMEAAVNYRANQCARKDALAAIASAVGKVEL